MGTRDEDKLARGLGETESDARVRTTALVIIAFAVVLFMLVQARFLLISLAVAIILFSLTSDVIRLIARQRIGRFAFPNWLASIIALVLISGFPRSFSHSSTPFCSPRSPMPSAPPRRSPRCSPGWARTSNRRS